MHDFNVLLTPDIREFIRENAKADIPTLALKGSPYKEWPFALILDQIKARRQADVKLPTWLACHDVIFPKSALMEQASSTATARYKASLVKGKKFVDLTAGAGVDTWAFSHVFDSGVSVDCDRAAVDLLTHNMSFLVKKSLDTLCLEAESFIQDMPYVDFTYIDPQRRNERKKGLYVFSDCVPDIDVLLPILKGKTRHVMIKASPMIDITQALKVLPHVRDVYVVEWRGDCREILFIVDWSVSGDRDVEDVPITVAVLNDDGDPIYTMTCTKRDDKSAKIGDSLPGAYRYEPSPGFQKSGAFSMIGHTYGLRKLHIHTHVYTSDDLRTDFPGRIFEVQNIFSVHRKSVPFRQANLTVRNFPAQIDVLRKKLALKEGGAEYLFACTLSDERKALIPGRKIYGQTHAHSE